MNFIKRGGKSIRIYWGKNLLFLSIILLLGTVVAGAVIANQAINRTAERLRLSVPTITIVGEDKEAISEFYSSFEQRAGTHFHLLEPLTSEIIRQIGALPYVQYYEYILGWSAWSRLLEPYIPIKEGGIDTEAYFSGYSVIRGETMRSHFSLTGVSQPDFVQLEEGLYELIQGRTFTELELDSMNEDLPTPVLIPTTVAELNDLSVGSVFNLYLSLFTPPPYADIPEEGFASLDFEDIWEHPYDTWALVAYEFEVIGLLDIDLEPALHWESHAMQVSIYSSLFVPVWKVESMRMDEVESERTWKEVFNPVNDYLGVESATLMGGGAIWVLKDPLYLDDFKVAANQILPRFQTIEDFSQGFDPLTYAMGTLEEITNQALIFAIGAAIIVLSLLITLYLRDRRNELGIYLALGEKKIKIILQLLIEVTAVALIGMTLALFIGNVIARDVSQELLIHELTEGWVTEQTQMLQDPEAGRWYEELIWTTNLEFAGLVRALTPDELMAFFDVSLNTQTIVIFYAIGLSTVMLSAIAPTIYVLELNPKEILLQGKIG